MKTKVIFNEQNDITPKLHEFAGLSAKNALEVWVASIRRKDMFDIYPPLLSRPLPIIIEIEGTDSAGKATQSKRLKEWLESLGYNVGFSSFPRYECESSQFVKDYLNGKFGTDPNAVDACKASLFFTVDRLISFLTEDWAIPYQTPRMIKNSEVYDFIIFDRYSGSNMIHQSCKLLGNAKLETMKSQIEDFCNTLYKIEHRWLRLPDPDIVLFLDMPCWASDLLRKSRLNKIDGSETQDIHERNQEYLMKVNEVSKFVCGIRQWKYIPCTEELKIRSIDDIHNSLKNIVKEYIKFGTDFQLLPNKIKYKE